MNKSEIEVDQFEMKKTSHPGILRAAVGVCIAIGFYDPKTKSGYMMHEPDFHHVDLENRIQTIKSDYGDLSRLKIFVTGNTLTSNDDPKQREYEKWDREYVEETLRKYFNNSQLQIEWLPDDHGAELSLDTSTGKFKLDVDSFEELRKLYLSR